MSAELPRTGPVLDLPDHESVQEVPRSGEEGTAPPCGASLGDYARISAELAEGRETLPEVLGRHGLSLDKWQEVSTCWTAQIATDVFSGDGSLAEAYNAAFVDAQDAIRPPAPMTIEEWAALVHAIDAEGVAPALATRGLTRADYLRLSRDFARQLGRDRALAHRYAQVFCELTQRRGETEAT